MEDIRSYWRNPSLVSRLSKEEKRKITKKFFELVAKDKEKSAEWRSKLMKERNNNFYHSCASDS